MMVENAQLLVLGGLGLALIYLPFAGRQGGWVRAALKTAPLTAFALAAYVGGAPAFLTVALALSALGDFALARPGQKAFLYGLAAFALAHLLFILAFQTLSPLPLWDAFATAPLAAVALILLALSTELWLAPHTNSLSWPVRGYILLIAGMGLAALVLPTAYWIVMVGAGLFIASDLILSIRQFRLRDASPGALWASRALWVLYIAGQGLILTGILTA